MKSVRAIKTNSVPNSAINFPCVRASILCIKSLWFLDRGYSKCQRAGILSARGRVFYRRIPARWHLEDAITLYNEVSTKNMVPAIDQSDCEIPLCYSLNIHIFHYDCYFYCCYLLCFMSCCCVGLKYGYRTATPCIKEW